MFLDNRPLEKATVQIPGAVKAGSGFERKAALRTKQPAHYRERSRRCPSTSSPRTPVIYEIVRRLGDEEMDRPVTSLWWSGIAAGLSISFSLLAQGILQAHLPEAPWRPLVVSLGYSVGFLMVVMSRQQLFTESTVTAVLPVMAKLTRTNLWRLGRLWGVVLLANIAGTLIAAAALHLHPGPHAGTQNGHARNRGPDL